MLTGGRPFGVMQAAMRGAKRVHGSLTIGVMPSADDTPSSYVDVAIRTDLGHGRNNVNVLTSDVVFACGMEGPGTASEVALAIKNGRPIVLVAPDEAASRYFLGLPGGKIRVVPSADEAAAIAADLLDNR